MVDLTALVTPVLSAVDRALAGEGAAPCDAFPLTSLVTSRELVAVDRPVVEPLLQSGRQLSRAVVFLLEPWGKLAGAVHVLLQSRGKLAGVFRLPRRQVTIPIPSAMSAALRGSHYRGDTQ